MIEWVLFGGNE